MKTTEEYEALADAWMSREDLLIIVRSAAAQVYATLAVAAAQAEYTAWSEGAAIHWEDKVDYDGD